MLHRRIGVVKNRQDFPHFVGWVWIKKLVQENRILIGIWNIESLTRKFMTSNRIECWESEYIINVKYRIRIGTSRTLFFHIMLKISI